MTFIAVNNIVLIVAAVILGLGIYAILGVVIYRCIKKKENNLKQMMADPLREQEAQAIMAKRKKLSDKASAFMIWYYPVLGVICIALGSIPIYSQLEKTKLIQGVLAMLLGLYFLIMGIARLYGFMHNKQVK